MASSGLKHSETAAGDLVIAIRISRTVKGLCYTSYFKSSVFPEELELFTDVMNECDMKEKWMVEGKPLNTSKKKTKTKNNNNKK